MQSSKFEKMRCFEKWWEIFNKNSEKKKISRWIPPVAAQWRYERIFNPGFDSLSKFSTPKPSLQDRVIFLLIHHDLFPNSPLPAVGLGMKRKCFTTFLRKPNIQIILKSSLPSEDRLFFHFRESFAEVFANFYIFIFAHKQVFRENEKGCCENTKTKSLF
jgi:hypothetical protein